MAKQRNGSGSNKKRRGVPDGMSLRKHARSGTTPRPKIVKVLEARDANEASEQRAAEKERRKPPMYGSVAEALEDQR